jgi:tellurite resistance protein
MKRPLKTRTPRKLSPDQALIALFIGAMAANGHVAADEAARAHHLIWSTRRFRRKSGDQVGRMIQEMKRLIEESDASSVIRQASQSIPARGRASAFAVLADLLLADGKLDPSERKFLERTGTELKLDPEVVRQVMNVVLLKNQL